MPYLMPVGRQSMRNRYYDCGHQPGVVFEGAFGNVGSHFWASHSREMLLASSGSRLGRGSNTKESPPTTKNPAPNVYGCWEMLFYDDTSSQTSVSQFSDAVVSDSLTPWTAARQASLFITNSRSLLKLMSIMLMIPSNHLILCRPLLLSSIFPSTRVFSNESVLCIMAKVLELQH